MRGKADEHIKKEREVRFGKIRTYLMNLTQGRVCCCGVGLGDSVKVGSVLFGKDHLRSQNKNLGLCRERESY